jgi:Mg-chelatase subunit ChlI
MNKRSAAIVAAGLVAVLTLGGLAYSRGLTGLGVSVAAAAGERVSHPKPIVRTQTKRKVVHRSAPAPAPRIVYSQAPSTYTAASSGAQDQSGSNDGTYEGEGEDHEYDGQEGQDDQEEQDSQSGDQSEGGDD